MSVRALRRMCADACAMPEFSRSASVVALARISRTCAAALRTAVALSGMDWLPDGRLLTTGTGLSRIEPDGSMVPHADLNHLAGDWNELVVDGRGNVYVNGRCEFDFSGGDPVYERIDAAILHLTGWMDGYVDAAFRMQARCVNAAARRTIDAAMDLFADEIGMDPAEIRRVNFIQPGQFPLTTPTGANYDSGEYEKALDAALANIERQFGKGSVMRLGDETRAPLEVIPTGAIALDVALGIGGLPRGRVVEIYGPEASGKTTLTLSIIAQAHAIGVTQFCPRADTVTSELIDRLHAEGFVARAWSVTTEELMQRLVQAGVDGMTVNGIVIPGMKFGMSWCLMTT